MSTLLYFMASLNLLGAGFLLNDVCRSIDAKDNKWRTDAKWVAAALFNVIGLTFLAHVHR